MNRRALRWGAWLLGLLACAVIVARTPIVTDITAFLPGPATREQALLAAQLRDGVAARVMLVGVEAANTNDAPAAARLSQQMAAKLRTASQFALVINGDPAMFATERNRLFDARYLLSPGVTAQRFSTDGLAAAASELEALLRSEAAPLIKPFAARDPTGEMLALAAELKPARAPQSAHGVWFDPDGRTALLLATTRAPGFDVDAQLQAVTAIRAAFNAAAANSSGLQLHLTGPGVFAVQSRQAIQDDARRLTIAAAIGVGLLLLLVLRSPRFLLWAVVPTATGALAGLAAVAVAFGSIHGITLGFGLTLIGEAVDYAIYVQVQRRGERNATTWRDDENAVLWRGLWLAVLTSGAGFVAMMLSGFAGLMQLGLMSIVGIAVAATVARFCLPDVLRPLKASQLARWEPLTQVGDFTLRLRIAVWAVAAAAAVLLIARSDRLWNDELVAISPLPRGAGEMDARLRSSVGLGDLRYVIAVEGATVDQALGRAEALDEPLRQLRKRAAIAGFDSPATLVPSLAKQSERRAALPDETTLRARLAQALAKQGLRVEAFAPFIADVARAREQVITRDYYAGTALGQRLASQVIEGAQPAALITLTGVSDATAVSMALRGLPGVSFVDLAAVQTLVANYRVRAAWAALGGGLLIVLILAAQLRSVKTTARIVTAVAVAIVITAAALVLIEQRLTLFHLIALLLAAGVGSNYAVFIGMPRDRQPAAPVVLSVMLAAATTLIAFAALAWSSTPVLHMIGITVAIGAPVGLLAAMSIAAPKAKQHTA